MEIIKKNSCMQKSEEREKRNYRTLITLQVFSCMNSKYDVHFKACKNVKFSLVKIIISVV